MNIRKAVFLFIGVSILISQFAGAERFTFDSDGVAISYTVEGEGEPVLLLHGFRASGYLNWDRPGIAPLLAEKYQVITMDARGHGRSERPANDVYGAEMVADVLRLLDHLEIDSVHVVGYSMGGMMAFKLMTDHPERIRTAIVAGMGWFEAGSEDARSFADREAGPRYTACLRQFAEFAVEKDAMLATKVPVTVIIGTEDRILRTRVKPLQDIRPDIPVVLIEGANHLSCVFNATFKEKVKAVLDQQVAGAAQRE